MSARRRRRSWAGALVLVAVLCIVLVGVITAPDDEVGTGAPPTSAASPTAYPSATSTSSPSPAEPTVGNGRPPTSDATRSMSEQLQAFRERCLRETTSLDTASVFYESPVRLVRARPHRFTLELRPTTRVGDDPSGRLRRHGRIALACTVQARLLDAPDALEVAPSSWEGRRFLPPSPSRWTWVVTARTHGRTDTVLQLKPVVQIVDGDRLTVRDLGVVEYDVTFSAPAPPAPSVPLLQRVGDLLASSWKVLVGLATGVSAILAALVAVRGLRTKKASGADAPVAAPEDRSSELTRAADSGDEHR